MPSGPERDDRGSATEVEPATLRSGALFNRYFIIDVHGVGGAGIVYAAYDPDLDRKVALKLVRASAKRSERRRARLIREAQSLARLSHPNVVPVYEVGTTNDQVFVAMEFIEGQTIREWVAAEPRSWAEILAKYVQAGRGLAAAHAAEIIHRDFKPENVLVGHDQRVRVLDFGLAAPAGDLASEVGSGRYELDEVSDHDVVGSVPNLFETPMPITLDGRVMGTPAYMAPEQAEGHLTDARADQYAFCVALWEALFGSRPRRDRAPKIKRDHPGATDVPTRIRKALERGLANAPAERHASMTELLAALEAPPRGAPLWLAAVVVVLAVVTSAVATLAYRSTQNEACQPRSAQLEGVWDQAIRTRIGARLVEQSKNRFAATTWTTIARELDDYTQRWLDAGVAVCEATTVEHRQSAELLDLRMSCLDRQLGALSAITEALSLEPNTDETSAGQGAARILDEALDAALTLDEPERCAQALRVAELGHRAPEPTVQVQIETTRDELARVEGLLSLGQTRHADKLLSALEERGRELDHDPLSARLRLARGALVELTGDDEAARVELRESWLLAHSVGDDELALEAATRLVALEVDEAELDEAQLWQRIAESHHARLGNAPWLVAKLQLSGAELAYARGEFQTALERFERALDLTEERRGPTHVEVAQRLVALARARRRLGQFERAHANIDRALGILEAKLGPEHPRRALALNELGSVERSQGRDSRALALHRQALSILEQAYADIGGRHDDVAMTWNLIGISHHSLADYEAMKGAFERARDTYLARHGPEHGSLVNVHQNLATAAAELGDLDSARAAFEDAYRIATQIYGPRHMTVGFIHSNLGELECERERPALAERHFSEAEAIWTERVGPTHELVLMARGGRARALHLQGQVEAGLELQHAALEGREAGLGLEHAALADHLLWIGVGELAQSPESSATQAALAALDRALALLEAADGPAPSILGQVHFHRARALAREPETRDQAPAAARAAIEVYRAAGRSQARRLAEVEAWLDAHQL